MPDVEKCALSEQEKEDIAKLKEKFKGHMREEMHDDTELFVRFLQAQAFDVNKAESMINKMLEWRKRLGVDTLLENFQWPEAVRTHFENNRIGFDKKGNIVHYAPMGKLDPKGLWMSAKVEDMEKSGAYTLEENEKILLKKRNKTDVSSPGYVHIYNMEGLSFATATDKKAIELFIRSIKMYEDYYPGRLQALYIINMSPYISIPLSIVKNFISVDLFNRARFFGTDGWKEELLNIMDADQLPAFLGGKRTDPDGNPECKTIVIQGGKIDEKYYIHKSKNPLSSSPGVQKMVLSRASFSEMEVEVNEDGSLIEWQFETKTRDIGFGLFYKEIVSGEEKITELVPLLRINTEDYAETGVYKCEKAGTYVIVFDNSYSWLRSKEIYYKTNVISPKEHEASLQKTQ